LTWLLAIVLGLVGVILCVTIILIPLGIVVLRFAKSLLGTSMRLFLPRAVTHPLQELDKSGRTTARRTKAAVGDAGKKGRKAVKGRKRRLAGLV
jgi:hypothetical protein